MTRGVRVLLVAPTAREAAAIGNGALACGAGPRAAEAVGAMLSDGGAGLVLIAGVCGGLDPSLTPGDLVLARRAVSESGDETSAQHALFEVARRAMRSSGLGFVSSSLLTTGRPVADRAEKTALWNAHGAGGVDMETYGVARAADAHGVLWLALRAVLDPAHAGLPASLRGWQGEGDADVLRRAVRRPLEWLSYARLALAMRRATRSLRAALPAVIASVEDALDPAAASGAPSPVSPIPRSVAT